VFGVETNFALNSLELPLLQQFGMPLKRIFMSYLSELRMKFTLCRTQRVVGDVLVHSATLEIETADHDNPPCPVFANLSPVNLLEGPADVLPPHRRSSLPLMSVS